MFVSYVRRRNQERDCKLAREVTERKRKRERKRQRVSECVCKQARERERELVNELERERTNGRLRDGEA